MERRGQDRDLGFNPDSPLKLPLAPILSTPPDRRGTAAAAAAAPTRRGSAIFSPTQTLDHHHHLLPHNNRHHLSPQQPPPQLKEPSPDPDPSTPTHDGPSNSRTPPSPSPPLPPPPPAAAAEAPSSGVRYRECLKNHAASMGGHVVDGCGEFMPNGEDGTAEALRCAACDCHRNFHRKESDGESHQPPPPTSYRTTLTSPALAAAAAHHHSQGAGAGAGFSAAAPAMVSFGGGGTGEESSSEDLAMFQSSGGGHAGSQPSYSGSRKRFRTKFSQEQKDRMQEVAERLGWRIQKQDEQLVQQLCQETGINRQVFKVWMHNNKQAMKKKQI